LFLVFFAAKKDIHKELTGQDFAIQSGFFSIVYINNSKLYQNVKSLTLKQTKELTYVSHNY